jgi:hypothetical protein
MTDRPHRRPNSDDYAQDPPAVLREPVRLRRFAGLQRAGEQSGQGRAADASAVSARLSN